MLDSHFGFALLESKLCTVYMRKSRIGLANKFIEQIKVGFSEP